MSVETWDESRSLLQQHPELLDLETDSAMREFAREQEDEEAKEVVEEHRQLLARCREVGVEQAFTEKTRLVSVGPGEATLVPSDFKADIYEADRLERLAQREPQARQLLIQVYERILGRLRRDEHPSFYAATQNNLGAVYAELPTDEQGTNLTKAIECYRKALAVYTLETAPFEYALTQSNLGQAIADLPIGDQATNLEQAISCYCAMLAWRRGFRCLHAGSDTP